MLLWYQIDEYRVRCFTKKECYPLNNIHFRGMKRKNITDIYTCSYMELKKSVFLNIGPHI